MSNITLFREKIDNLKGRRDQIKDNIESALSKIEKLEQEIVNGEEAQARIQLVAKQTQDQLKFYFESPVDAAMSGVFDDPYEFELRFETRRGQTEADLIFKKDGTEHKDLTYGGGGGESDVAAYGLQVAALSMKKGLRRFLLLDEPLKHLKSADKTLEKRGGLMIGETGRGLKIQILMVSHIPEQQEGSDRVFRLRLENKKTVAEVL
jgi:hypothetical protein